MTTVAANEEGRETSVLTPSDSTLSIYFRTNWKNTTLLLDCNKQKTSTDDHKQCLLSVKP